MDYLQELLFERTGHRARHTFKRVLTILKVMVAQLDILETMTPLEFLSFRDRLESGERIPVGPVPRARVRARLEGADGFERYPGGHRRSRRLERRWPRRRCGTRSCVISP